MWVCLHLLKFLIYYVGSGGQLSPVFDLRPISYLEHCEPLVIFAEKTVFQ